MAKKFDSSKLLEDLLAQYELIKARVDEAMKSKKTSSKEIARLLDAQSKIMKSLLELVKMFGVSRGEQDLVKLIQKLVEADKGGKKELISIKMVGGKEAKIRIARRLVDLASKILSS